MSARRFFSLLASLAFSSGCVADTIGTFTFTGDAGSTLSGSIVFRISADGTAGLPDVMGLNVSVSSIYYTLEDQSPSVTVLVPAVNYGLADLSSFRFYPDPAGCANAMSTGPQGNRIFPASDVCDWLIADFFSPVKPSLALTVEFDPRIGQVGSAVGYTPVPDMPGFHGGVNSFGFDVVAAPEPSTLACLAAAVAVCLAWGRVARRYRD
ncbi:MAG: hypothetical protein ABUS49_11905 [Acidobacteriota bacterium]